MSYTMLLLKQMGLAPQHLRALPACRILLARGFYRDGGINFFKSFKHSETCVPAMILSLLAYFRFEDEPIPALVEPLLAHQMPDGGGNCQFHNGATPSSFHGMISVLEGLRDYEKFQPQHIEKIQQAQQRDRESRLLHRLFRSQRTGEVARPEFTLFSFPPRWPYDVLRPRDYFQAYGAATDDRLAEVIAIVLKRRTKRGQWLLQNRNPSRMFVELEQVGENALRVLKWGFGDQVIG